MRVLVFSDAHGNINYMKKALENEDATVVFYLGDGIREVRELASIFNRKTFYFVKGNCDTVSEKTEGTVNVANTDIFYTHGHLYGVKSGMGNLVKRAKAVRATVALYGHTHIPRYEYIDGVHIVCPGSIKTPGILEPNYAVIDIKSEGILVSLKRA